MEIIGVIALSTGIAYIAARTLLRMVVIREGWAGLVYVNGRFGGVLRPGRYYRLRHTTQVDTVDLRGRVITLTGQEVISGDGVGLRISAAIGYEVAEPAIALHVVQDYEQALYAHAQLALRSAVGGMGIDEMLANRAEIGRRALAAATAPAAQLGLRLRMLEVRDVMFPGEFKRAFAEVVRARQEGQAAIERARAESAVLRNLANSARLLEDNPALMNLRLLQSATGSGGNTLVLGVPDALSQLTRKRSIANGKAGEDRADADRGRSGDTG